VVTQARLDIKKMLSSQMPLAVRDLLPLELLLLHVLLFLDPKIQENIIQLVSLKIS
jgi:hypothetical protein